MKLLIAATSLPVFASAFLGTPTSFRASRHVVFLEDDIASLIDQQLWRQTHRSEVEAAWTQRQATVLEKDLPSDFAFDDHMMDENLSPRELYKDRQLAKKNPASYCADRCLATGNCDVFEDVFELSPQQVMVFCSDCVLSDGEEPCDIPEAYLDGGFDKLRP